MLVLVVLVRTCGGVIVGVGCDDVVAGVMVIISPARRRIHKKEKTPPRPQQETTSYLLLTIHAGRSSSWVLQLRRKGEHFPHHLPPLGRNEAVLALGPFPA